MALFSLVLVGPGKAFADSPFYLGFAGQPQGITQDDLIKELKSTFTAPVDAMKPDVIVYYKWQVDGANGLSLGLIVQDLNAEGGKKIASYISQLQDSSFHGMKVHFQKVVRIDETVTIFAGTHQTSNTDSGDQDLNSDYQIEKHFVLTSVLDWQNFVDKLGNAFMSNSDNFLSYLGWFIDNPVQFADLENHILSHDDVVAAERMGSIVLADGSTVSQKMGTSPFFYMPFIRNCYAAKFENGMCYRAK